jgi:RNA-binding protein
MSIPSSEAPLTPAERVVLRGAAHALKPTVMIGSGGVTPAVIAETQRALDAHQLIKIKMLSDDREARSAAHSLLCQELECHPVQVIGKMFVLFKDNGSYIPPTLMAPSQTKQKKGPHVPKKQLANA